MLWLRGVDLFSRPALIPRKLLIFQWAKMTKTATKANPSFSFHSIFVDKKLMFQKICDAFNAAIINDAGRFAQVESIRNN
jgi:hypothetical protein